MQRFLNLKEIKIHLTLTLVSYENKFLLLINVANKAIFHQNKIESIKKDLKNFAIHYISINKNQ